MDPDPTASDPDKYVVVFENDRVRVLEYTDRPGDQTSPHHHPDSVMVTLTSFRRRLIRGDLRRDVELTAGTASWLPAQQHAGQNIGDTPTHSILIELKEPNPSPAGSPGLGPSTG